MSTLEPSDHVTACCPSQILQGTNTQETTWISIKVCRIHAHTIPTKLQGLLPDGSTSVLAKHVAIAVASTRNRAYRLPVFDKPSAHCMSY